MRGRRLVLGVTKRIDFAFRAFRFPRDTQGSAVVNNLVGEQNPLFFRNGLHQIPLDFSGIGVLCEIQPARDALHMRIHYDTRCDSIRRSKDYVRRFTSGTGNGEQLVHGLRDLSTEIIQQSLRGPNQRFGLVVEEAGGSDILRQFGLAGVREVGDGWIFLKQAGCHFIHALVGALGGENGRSQQLPGIVVMECASGLRIHLVQQLEDFCGTRLALSDVLRSGNQFRRSGGTRHRLRDQFGFWHTDIILSRQSAFLVLIALIAFGSCLSGSFHFDDYSLFSGNLWHPFPTRPLTYATFSMNATLGGRDPIAYHAVNLALHVTATVLAYVALKALLPAWPAWIAAAIFAVHPFQAEPVNYVFARGTLLETVFCLAALLAWTRERHWWAVAWFAGALLSKEECVAFPILLLLLELSKSKSLDQWKPIAAMLALALIAGLRVFLVAQSTPGSQAGSEAGVSFAAYALTQGTVIWRYLRMLIVPWGFTIDPEIHLASPSTGALAWILLAALLALATLRFTRLQPGFWFMAGIVLLLPSSSVFPASDLAADRRLYLPMVGFAACAGLLLRRVRPVMLAPGLAVFIVLSFARTQTWRKEESLWSDAVAKAPDKVRPKIQLARAVEPARALELLKRAESIAPDDARIASEIGRVYLGSGHLDQALIAFGRALALAPGSADALNNRGAALLALGQTDAARQDFERALAANPCQFDARLNLLRIKVSIPVPAGCRFSREQLDALEQR